MARNNLILDRYRPLGSAGTGGFGTVQVAWDQRIQRKVAIKTIRLSELDAFRAALPGAEAVAGSGVDASLPRREPLPWEDDAEYEASLAALATRVEAGADVYADGVAGGGSGDDDLVPALAHIPGLDEARTAAKLSDPRIVAVYDFEVRDRMAYLIMEYVEGLTLTQLLDLYGDQLSLDEVAAVFQSVAGALQLAHESGVLHLDIKPDNILINAKGQVKVTDFGLATLADAAGLGTTGGGTIGYMPPEQMRRENLDARCDEWSLAAIAYEMLTGSNPFIVPSLDQAEQAILDAELVLPSLCWEDLDAEVDDVVFYALDPDCQERYDTVADFAEEMGKFLGDAEFGQQRLAALVSAELGLSDDEDDDLPWDEGGNPGRPARARRARRSLSERVTPRAVALGGRICATLMCGFVGAAAVSNMPFVLVQSQSTPAAVLAGALVAGALGLLRPDVGALAAFTALAAALVLANSPLPGTVLVVATVLWWYFCGRRGVAQGNAALSEPLAGAVGLGVFAPLAAGAYLRPAMAAGTACFVAVVALVMGSFGSFSLFGWDALSFAHFARIDVQGHFLAMLAQPSTWLVAASWVVAAWTEAVLGTRLGRFGVGAGYVLAAAVLALGVVASAAFGAGTSAAVASGAASGVAAGPPFIALLPIVISLAILIAAEFALRVLASDDSYENEED